jgi:hypothetical protein
MRFAITKAFAILSLASLVACACFGASDTNGPVLNGIFTVDAITLVACFDEPLQENSATNLAAYVLDDPKTEIVGVLLQTDQKYVRLFLSRPLSQTYFSLSWTNIFDLAGNSSFGGPVYGGVICLRSADIGSPGVDPVERGSATTCSGIVGGGSGIEGTNDACFFLYRDGLAARSTWKSKFIFSTPLIACRRSV